MSHLLDIMEQWGVGQVLRVVRNLHLSRRVPWGANNYVSDFNPLLMHISFNLSLVVRNAAVPVG